MLLALMWAITTYSGKLSQIFDHQQKFSPRNLGRGIPKEVWHTSRVIYIEVATPLAKCDVPVEVLSAELHATKA